MKKEFVMRGQTPSKNSSATPPVLGTETLNFSGFKPGMAYRLVDFELFPSTGIGSESNEFCAAITAEKTPADPTAPNFNDDGLIATCQQSASSNPAYPSGNNVVINDKFLITQNLILSVQDVSGNNHPINWQCKFESVKMSKSQEAVTNYKQFLISDGS